MNAIQRTATSLLGVLMVTALALAATPGGASHSVGCNEDPDPCREICEENGFRSEECRHTCKEDPGWSSACREILWPGCFFTREGLGPTPASQGGNTATQLLRLHCPEETTLEDTEVQYSVSSSGALGTGVGSRDNGPPDFQYLGSYPDPDFQPRENGTDESPVAGGVQHAWTVMVPNLSTYNITFTVLVGLDCDGDGEPDDVDGDGEITREDLFTFRTGWGQWH